MGEKTGAEDSEGELRGSPEDQRKRLPTAVNRLFEKSLVKFATQLDPPWLGKLSSAVSPTDRKREIELFRESFNHFDAKDEITYGGGDIQTLVKLGKLPPG